MSIQLIIIIWFTLIFKSATCIASDGSYLRNGIEANLSFSTAASVEKTNYDVMTDQSIKTNLNSEPAYGVGIKYLYVPKDNFGFNAGIHYFSQRTVQSMTTGDQRTVISDYKYQITLIELNMLHELQKTAWLCAGVNYPFIQESGSIQGAKSLSSAIGFQIGAGWDLGRNFSIEALYQIIELDDSTTSTFSNFSGDNSRTMGGVVRLGYTFDLK